MKKLLSVFIVLAVLASGVTSARMGTYADESVIALPKNWTVVPQAKVNKHLQIATKLTRYKMPFWKRPTAVIVPNEDFIVLACGPWGLMTNQCGVLGIFFPSDPDVVYIRQHPNILPEETDEILMHELVHWLQNFWGFEANFESCPNTVAHEVEAYSATYLYVVLYQKREIGFHTPDLTCGDNKNKKPTSGVIAPPVITKGAS